MDAAAILASAAADIACGNYNKVTKTDDYEAYYDSTRNVENITNKTLSTGSFQSLLMP